MKKIDNTKIAFAECCLKFRGLLYFSLFNSNLIYVCQIWGTDQNKELKEIEKHRKSNKDNKFPPLK